jgi:hypothetical protein
MVENSCSQCGFYIPANCCRDDIKTELINARLEGVCGEVTNQVMFIPYIGFAAWRTCGKFMLPV